MTRRPMSLAERISYLHETEKFFDVEFVLRNNGQTENVKAHKAIFAASSDAFEAMLYGPMAMGDKIEMNDIEPQAFKTLKRFVYTDDVAFKSVIHAQNVFKVADMYDLVQLSRLADAYVSANLSSATALRILEFTRSHQKLEMQERCLQIIRKETSAVLNSDDFVSCDLNFVDMIVSEKELNIKEIDLFNSVEKWAENNINLEDDPSANETQLLTEVINKIRFLSMTAEEFAKGPNNSSLLTKLECHSLLTNIVVPGSMPLPDRFSKERTPRNGAMIPVSIAPSGDFSPASNANLDFTSSEHGGITNIRWTKRGMSTLNLNVNYDSPIFKISGVPFAVYFNPYMDAGHKCLYIGLKCNQVNVNCKLDFTRRHLSKEGEPSTYSGSLTFNRTRREADWWSSWSWSTLVDRGYITSEDSLTVACDFKLTRL